ncbi:hypothetical protein [Mitsuaria sp. GD03876]|uniref:hypothetical protein n=1 Tax=Mitsuaria sp. GD03876 TaxID=2975399 RepID=UPI00244AECD5|nr:hypothetical protein [Mitsuaria sp. GD03876]MDH0866105.1 hypothetical protein [Mitsuaria sp. GD03876]
MFPRVNLTADLVGNPFADPWLSPPSSGTVGPAPAPGPEAARHARHEQAQTPAQARFLDGLGSWMARRTAAARAQVSTFAVLHRPGWSKTKPVNFSEVRALHGKWQQAGARPRGEAADALYRRATAYIETTRGQATQGQAPSMRRQQDRDAAQRYLDVLRAARRRGASATRWTESGGLTTRLLSLLACCAPGLASRIRRQRRRRRWTPDLERLRAAPGAPRTSTWPLRTDRPGR